MKRYAAFFTLGLLAGMMTMHSFRRELESCWEKENLKVELYEKKQIKKIESQQETFYHQQSEIELEITMKMAVLWNRIKTGPT